MKKAALISVSDKTGIVSFAQKLHELGYIILATSGSKAFLSDHGVTVESIELYTEQNEILGGRVKTLHPKIHAGLLAKRDDPEHMRQLQEGEIYPIDIAVINLYPFTQNLRSEAAGNPAKMMELVDIGGPTMIRASAKNFQGVLPVLDPADYDAVADELARAGSVEKTAIDFRRRLALKVFTFTANYDLQIAKYIAHVDCTGANSLKDGCVDSSTSFMLGEVAGVVLTLDQPLRYGENPHQKASFYRSVDGMFERSFDQLNGKELSYNNLLDFDAALRMAQSFPSTRFGAVIIKHLNPCGAAFGASIHEAVCKAKLGDPRSHFGGVIAVNKTLTTEAAEGIAGEFAEIVIAPGYEDEALNILRKNKNLRVLRVNTDISVQYEIRSIQSGVLVQAGDSSVSKVGDAMIMSTRLPSEGEVLDLEFVWTMCSHIKSNAIVVARDAMIIGVGAGQMSRVDSAELAVSKAKSHGHSLSGAVAASDAFFPFPDSVEFLASEGITAIIAPGGAKRDPEIVEACNKLNIALLFTADRHFRH